MAQDASLEPFDVPQADRPRHIAIIMDGNGRWAQRQGLPRAEGHRRGAASVRVITEECSRLGLEQLTLYCLSSENWKRPESELAILMHLLEQFMIEERGLIMKENIRVDMIGGREEIPESARRELQKTIDMSAANKGLRLCLAINYGGRGELVDAARRIAREAVEGTLRPDEITEETISARLHTAGMRDPDLLVRTAGELRVSNFLLWQISYAEMWVTQRCWPEFGVADLRQAMRDYAARNDDLGACDMLRWRLIVGTLFIAGLLGLGWLDWRQPMPGMILVPLALIFVMLASGEFLSLVAAMGYAPRRANVVFGNFLIVAVGAVSSFHPTSGSDAASLAWLLGGFALALLWAIASEIIHYDKSGRATANLAMTVFAYAYLGLLFGFMTQLRAFGGPRVGMVAFMSLVVVTKSADMGAYFAGRLFGRHKLIPAVSPGKTVEGLVGGAALATFASWLVFEKLMPMMVTPTTVRSAWGWVAFGLGLTLAGLAGDLIESVLKRDAGRKDSSTWMPGLGGVLDVVDSLLVAAPMAYGFWLLGFVGP